MEQNIQVGENAQCSEMRLLQGYADKLKIDYGILPDHVKNAFRMERREYLNEYVWSSINITDTSVFIDGTDPSNVIQKLMNEYNLARHIATSRMDGIVMCIFMIYLTSVTSDF
jgi:hypothetical protein